MLSGLAIVRCRFGSSGGRRCRYLPERPAQKQEVEYAQRKPNTSGEGRECQVPGKAIKQGSSSKQDYHPDCPSDTAAGGLVESSMGWSMMIKTVNKVYTAQ
jgi:hypothetical protein